jgi:hypothetical protein
MWLWRPPAFVLSRKKGIIMAEIRMFIIGAALLAFGASVPTKIEAAGARPAISSAPHLGDYDMGGRCPLAGGNIYILSFLQNKILACAVGTGYVVRVVMVSSIECHNISDGIA